MQNEAAFFARCNRAHCRQQSFENKIAFARLYLNRGLLRRSCLRPSSGDSQAS